MCIVSIALGICVCNELGLTKVTVKQCHSIFLIKQGMTKIRPPKGKICFELPSGIACRLEQQFLELDMSERTLSTAAIFDNAGLLAEP